MQDMEAYRIENAFSVRAIDSSCRGLKYFVDNDRRGIVIAGDRGMVGLTLKQAGALAEELPAIIETQLG